jgi:hypothetical protein
MLRNLALVLSLVLSSLPVSNSAHALDVQTAFKLLSKVPADFYDFGSVCEQLAKLQMYSKFSAKDYHVESGIVYTNSHGSVLGELDIVVFHRHNLKAVVVGEVKCWRKLGSAMKKARKQLARFANALKHNSKIHLYHDVSHKKYYKNQFLNQKMRSIYISQNGGEEFGFNMTIGLDHEQVKVVRSMLLKCQKSRKCAIGKKSRF